MLEIIRYESSLLMSNMYVVTEDNHAVIIDPFSNSNVFDGLIIDYIFLTHEHYDHISGVNALKDTYDAPVICSKACAANIENPRKNMSCYFKEFCELQNWIKINQIPKYENNYKCKANLVFDDKLMIDWLGHQWSLFALPGHSMGSICIILDSGYCFSGDSVLENIVTECRLPGGSRKLWKEISIPRLKELPKGIRIYPGHFKSFTYNGT